MSNRCILVVDNDADFTEELCEILTDSGYDTVVVNDGAAAAKTARRCKPAVILLDLKMPGKSGFQVADELRFDRRTSKVPIIAVTGFYSPKEEASLIDIYGIHTCLTKPVNPEYLLSNIQSVLEGCA